MAQATSIRDQNQIYPRPQQTLGSLDKAVSKTSLMLSTDLFICGLFNAADSSPKRQIVG
jgi:hypothetical protein